MLTGGTVVPAALAASLSGRSVITVAPGLGPGAAFRLDPAGADRGDRALCESIALPQLDLEAVREQARQVREVLSSGERRVPVRNQAIAAALAAVAASVWEPVLAAWPDLRGGRVALVPLGASALLPLFTAPVSGAPACTVMDLTVVPSGKALLFASAWPRSSHETVLVAADPWYDDGANPHIPFTVEEGRAVAATHGVAPLILREAVDGPLLGHAEDAASGPTSTADHPEAEIGLNDRLRTLTVPPRPGTEPSPPLPDALIARITAADLIHLACHGNPDPHEPLQSMLLLGQPVPLGTLLPRDLRRGTTIVLSACHLASIGSEQSSEQLGFPAAMLAMGAGSVIAALWTVPDSNETVRLMTYLHEQLLAPAVTPSIALGRAISQAVANGLRPAAWAPLTHFGG